MKPFIWLWSCHRSCLNSAPILVYRFSQIEITLSWFPCSGLLYRLLSICLYHLDSSFLVLLTIISRVLLGVWHRFDLLFAMEIHCTFDPEVSQLLTMLRHCVCRWFFVKLDNKKIWRSFSKIIWINKGGDYEFVAEAV